MSLLKLFGWEEKKEGRSSAETDTVRKIIRRLEGLQLEEARYVAAFAYVLSRVAHADMKVTEEETRAMEDIVRERAGLAEEQAKLVVEIAKNQSALFGETEDFLVTREFRNMASREQKLGLLRCLFFVSSSDNRISVREDNEIRQISRELGLEHRDFIEVRSAFREYVSFLRPRRGGRDSH